MCNHILIHLEYCDQIVCTRCGDKWEKKGYMETIPVPYSPYPQPWFSDTAGEPIYPTFIWTDGTVNNSGENQCLKE